MRHLLLILFLTPLFSMAQTLDLTVPDDILAELQTKTVELGPRSFQFKVKYPANYDAMKRYPIFLALPGGNQAENIAEYCYAAWFRSPHFDDYYTIIPFGDTKNLKDYEVKDINMMFTAINMEFNCKATPWVLGGTSNGGAAAFSFVAAKPAQFEGVITIPGGLGSNTPTDDWSHLRVLLAYGSEDVKPWINAAEEGAQALEGRVLAVEKMPLVGQGHILPLDFDLETIYQAYFAMPTVKAPEVPDGN